MAEPARQTPPLASDYDSESIKVLKGLDAVRKRPRMDIRDGEAYAPLSVVGSAQAKRGTEVTFLPRPRTFTLTEFDFATLEHRLPELAFLNSGVLIVPSDMRHPVEKREELRYEGGV